MKNILVTGGCGFIGSNFLARVCECYPDYNFINVDAKTYAARPPMYTDKPDNLVEIELDIRDQAAVGRVMDQYKPNRVINFAAESHVCRSIKGPKDFITTNINGTFNLLSEFHRVNKTGMFVQISTDEVFGQIQIGEFTEQSPLDPRSPYAASKAASEMIVNAWLHTYDLDTIIINMCNIFGPNQHEEKLVPMAINNILNRKPVRMFGTGLNMREWMHVRDAVEGIRQIAFAQEDKSSLIGNRYVLGTRNVITNKHMVAMVHQAIEEVIGFKLDMFTEYSNDRPTDDCRYALNPLLAENELGFDGHMESFSHRLRDTVQWYVERAKLPVGRDARQGSSAEEIKATGQGVVDATLPS